MMRVRILCAAVLAGSLAVSAGAPVTAQARRTTKVEAPQVQCPATLGTGMQTGRVYCDVLTGREPADGIQVSLPPHTGTVVLTFDLHNRHLYSEDLIQADRAYRRYTATIGVLTPDNTLISRAVVQNEFRTAADLVERIAADTGPGAVKAVAPTGSEPVRVTIPANVASVSILGEKLNVIRPDGVDNFTTPGRPVAVISNVMIEYTPAPARRRR
jgi:hypothetical protein